MSSSATDRSPERFVLRVDRFHTRQVKHRVQQHRGMANGQDKSVSVGPNRMVRIEAQEPLPQPIDHWRQRHGRARDGRSWPAAPHPSHSVRMVLTHNSSFLLFIVSVSCGRGAPIVSNPRAEQAPRMQRNH